MEAKFFLISCAESFSFGVHLIEMAWAVASRLAGLVVLPCCSYVALCTGPVVRTACPRGVTWSRTRTYSRLLQDAVKRRGRRIQAKTFQLIDEEGNSLGDMDRDTALQIAEGKGLDIVEVRKESKDVTAICKLVSKRQLWEDGKKEREQAKKNPRNITKELKVSSNISEHDLTVKTTHCRQFLEQLHNVKVTVEARSKKFAGTPEEQKKQSELMENIAKSLDGVGGKVSKESFGVNGKILVCTFKSIV